jgi:hypothetical protein
LSRIRGAGCDRARPERQLDDKEGLTGVDADDLCLLKACEPLLRFGLRYDELLVEPRYRAHGKAELVRHADEVQVEPDRAAEPADRVGWSEWRFDDAAVNPLLAHGFRSRGT